MQAGQPVDAGNVPRLRVATELGAEDAARVLALAEAAAEADGAQPLGEHVVLHLRHGGDHSVHLLAEDASGDLLGYAHLDLAEPGEGPAAELAVSPGARGRGVGAQLLGALVDRAAEHSGALRLWAHGDAAPATRLATAHGFTRIRRLWQMRRSLYAPLPAVDLPEGVHLRPFDRERDARAWLALNALAFADLPDQGTWTEADLAGRVAEPWFDPAGFLLASTVEGQLVGFHWTKVHAHAGGSVHQHDPIGEVYVVGVDPAHRGRGLGRALTLAGLHHLRRAGLGAAMLYVDSDNAAAISLYRSLGFAVWDSDTLFGR
jgi:mycothiol synthase